jgi:hypothetical protein
MTSKMERYVLKYSRIYKTEPAENTQITLRRERRSVMRKRTCLMTVWLCFLAIGCQDIKTIWSAEAPSPDGHWVATARTIQHFGPGTAGVETNVYLKRTNDSNPPAEVLGFFHDPRDTSHTIDLTMKWITPSHLEVTYDGRADLSFQVVKFGGLDITVRNLSRPNANSSE